MATYEYRCPTCETRFELRRPMSDSSAPAVCPEGHDGAVRLLSVFASVTGGESSPAGMSMPSAPCGPSCACHPG
jgi:putative FmdB family regulatory protein